MIGNRKFTDNNYVNGSAVCALDAPSAIFTVRSNIECSLMCLQHGPVCNHFNVKFHEKTIQCEVFEFTPIKYGVFQNCNHHVVKCGNL